MPGPPTRVPVRRSRYRGALVAAVVLAGVLVVADRAALAVAENAAAATLQRDQQLDRRPSVDIAGFPFLNQLATGHYDRIRVRAEDVPVGEDGNRLTISRVDIVLRDVHVARNFRSGRSEAATASALLAYRDLSRSLGARFTYAGEGRVRAAASVTVAGAQIDGSATAAVRLSGDRLSFADEQIDVGDVSLPEPVSAFFGDLFASSISLAGLPFGVRVEGLRAGQDGVAITLTAKGLTFTR